MELICIVCPNGCHLEAHKTPQRIIITGNKCPRGDVYGREEMTEPHRVVTATVATNSDSLQRVPVRTNTSIPKQLIADLLNELYLCKVNLPVHRGDKLLSNFKGTGADVVFTRSVK